MKVLLLVFCLGSSSIALAGDGSERHCEPCLDIDDAIYTFESYQTISGTTVGQPNGEVAYMFGACRGCTYRFTFCEGGG